MGILDSNTPHESREKRPFAIRAVQNPVHSPAIRLQNHPPTPTPPARHHEPIRGSATPTRAQRIT